MSTKQELLEKIAELEELVELICECDDATLTVRELEAENKRLLEQQAGLLPIGFVTDAAFKELSNAVNWVVYTAQQLGYRADATRTAVEEIPGAVSFMARRSVSLKQLVKCVMPLSDYARHYS